MRAHARRLVTLVLPLLTSLSFVACDVVGPESAAESPASASVARGKAASLEVDGVAYAPTPGSRLVPRRDGGVIGVRGLDGSSGIVLTPSPSTPMPSHLLRGVDLGADGVQFTVEISGVAAGYATAPERSLVINLSLGWELGILRVAGDYPSGCGQASPGVGALTYASCRGSIVVALRQDAPVELASRADEVVGVRVDRIDFDPEAGVLEMQLREAHRSGRSCDARLRFRPTAECASGPYRTLGLVLDDTQGDEAQVWRIAPRRGLPGDPIVRDPQIGQ